MIEVIKEQNEVANVNFNSSKIFNFKFTNIQENLFLTIVFIWSLSANQQRCERDQENNDNKSGWIRFDEVVLFLDCFSCHTETRKSSVKNIR